VTSARLAEPSLALAEPSAFSAFFSETAAIAHAELKKLLRDPTELFSRGVQPVLWLVIFGQVFSKVRGIPTGQVSYLAFLTPGILAQSALFTAIFYGIAVIWERDLGIIHKLLVSPARRASLVTGKAMAAGFRGVVQTFIIYVIAVAMRVSINWNPLAILGVLFAVALGSAAFSMFSLIIACIVKSRERFMGIGQVLTMPLFFASNAIYPIAIMPNWLKVVAFLNPLTYLVDALRGIMIRGGAGVHLLVVDLGVLALIFVLLASLAAKLYPSLVR
jgi:ABC-2 type transport system permease protein